MAAVESAFSDSSHRSRDSERCQSGLVKYLFHIDGEGEEIVDNLKDAIVGKIEDIKDAGKQLLEGLWNGIKDKVEWLKSKVTGVVDTIKGWFTGKSGFDEHSPSKWASDVFRRVLEGGEQGLRAGLPDLMREVDTAVNSVRDGFDADISMHSPTSVVDFASSGIGRASAATINSINSTSPSVMSTAAAPFVIQLMLNGRVAAEELFDPLKAFARANGTPITA